jgi:hypothetical protein
MNIESQDLSQVKKGSNEKIVVFEESQDAKIKKKAKQKKVLFC